MAGDAVPLGSSAALPLGEPEELSVADATGPTFGGALGPTEGASVPSPGIDDADSDEAASSPSTDPPGGGGSNPARSLHAPAIATLEIKLQSQRAALPNSTLNPFCDSTSRTVPCHTWYENAAGVNTPMLARHEYASW
jgi:hypothetical protein